MTDFSSESRALLRGAREEFEAGDGDRKRVDRKLAVRLGVTVSAIAGTATSVSAGSAAVAGGAKVAAGAAAAGSAFLPVAKWLGVALLVGAVGAGGVSAVRAHRAHRAGDAVLVVPSPPQARTAIAGATGASATSLGSEVPAPLSPTAQAAALAPPIARDRPVQRPSSRAAIAEPTDRPSATVAAEARLLRSADEALRDGDPTRALARLREHERTYPNGVLAEERSVELVSTLCSLGRVAEAREEADRFLRATPESPLAASVRRSCAAQ